MEMQKVFVLEVDEVDDIINSKSFKDEEFKDHSLKVMYDFMKDNVLTDVTLISDKDQQRFSAHRVVLSAASDYFTAMFTCNLKESSGTPIVFKEIDGNILKQIIEFCYTGHIEINVNNSEDLFIASNMFQFDFIKNSCNAFFIKELDVTNCFGILNLANRYSSKELSWKTQQFINEHFEQVIKHRDFLNLEVNYIIQLLRDEHLNIKNEAIAFEAVQKWISFDSNRQKYIPVLMSFIELNLVHVDFLFDIILPFCASFNECLNLIIETARWHLQPTQRLSLKSKFPRSRESILNHILVVGGIRDGEDDIMGSEMYCPKSNEWYSLSNIYPRKMDYSAVVINQKLYTLGGRHWNRGDNLFECVYSPNENSKERFPSMWDERFSFGVAITNENLYAIGGTDGIDYLNTTERFNLKTKKWMYIALMNYERSNLGVTVLNGRVYAIGGRNKSGVLKCVEMYDQNVNKWSVLDPMITGRFDFGVAAFNGYIYVYGGSKFKHCVAGNSFDRYDPKTNTWIPLLNFGCFRYCISLILIGESVICVGGHNGVKAVSIVEKYNINKSIETAITELKYPRANPALFNVEEQLPSLLNQCFFCQKK